MRAYNPSVIEPKWQKVWEKQSLYQATDFAKRPKKYILVEFPYPSGAGLHVGHVWGYTMGDVLARFYRMRGQNVLFPMGWDAFGLPAENYAIKTGIHPSITAAENIARFRQQMDNLGLSFDWKREINTTDPEYYRFTQWIFIQMFKKRLAYKKTLPINWCPQCRLGLADEEVLADGTHERCGSKVTQRMLNQWLLKITSYADRLLDDLEGVNWPPEIKLQQINWIGRSKGTEVEFSLLTDPSSKIRVFTTRPDTIFGATALILAPEHPLVESMLKGKHALADLHKKEVEQYIEQATHRSELERIGLAKEKSGVFTGLDAINPANDQKIPIWVADYVVGWYGGGAVMLVPAHDQRDLEFAKKFNLPIRRVIRPKEGSWPDDKAFEGEGELVNSGQFNALASDEAKEKITAWLAKKGLGRPKVAYRLRDWIFSRQHYWGEPIPMVECQKCGWIPIPEEELPLKLPHVERYQPTQTGESPLASIKEWVKTSCPQCKGSARRETDTMPNWAGSSWYYLRFTDPHNQAQLAAYNKLAYYLPVDIYLGGAEHTTLHLLYSRFWHKFLYDLKVIPTPEPYWGRFNRGIILGEDGRKMSKSFGNVINPDDVVKEFSADTLRVYELFLGPLNGTYAWNTQGVKGVRRFLQRIWDGAHYRVKTRGGKRKGHSKQNQQKSDELTKSLHKTIKKVTTDLARLKFNTAIAALMEFVNKMEPVEEVDSQTFKTFLLLLAPLAPHLSEELWQLLKMSAKDEFSSIHQEKWPVFDPKMTKAAEVTIIVQINGKLRATFKSAAETQADQKEVSRLAHALPQVQKYLQKKSVKKVVFVPGRLINFVI